MKRIVEQTEGDGLEAMLGKKALFCCNSYFYYGEVVGVNAVDIVLKNARVVYDYSPDKSGFATSKNVMAEEWRIRTSHIESYGEHVSD